MLFGNLREDLNEIERPVFPRKLLGIREPVVPGLEFIKEQHRRRVPQEFEDQLIGWNIRLRSAHSFPFAFDEGPMRVLLEKEIPKELVTLAMKTLADNEHAAP